MCIRDRVDSFKKIQGNAMATTMCIGNLRSATDLLCAYTETDVYKRQALACVIPFYLIIIASFTSDSTLIREGYPLFLKELSLELSLIHI